MLVLSRRKDEIVKVFIPCNGETKIVEIMVVDSQGDKVRLGFTAPEDIVVHRQEVVQRILDAGGSIFS